MGRWSAIFKENKTIGKYQKSYSPITDIFDFCQYLQRHMKNDAKRLVTECHRRGEEAQLCEYNVGGELDRENWHYICGNKHWQRSILSATGGKSCTKNSVCMA